MADQGLMGIKTPTHETNAPPEGHYPKDPDFNGTPYEDVEDGTWTRHGPGIFTFEPSEADLQHMPGNELPDWFMANEPKGMTLLMPDGREYEGTLSHEDLGIGGVEPDGDETGVQPLPPLGQEPSPKGMDEVGSTLPPTGIPPMEQQKSAPGGPNSWMNKPSAESKAPVPSKHY